MSPIVGSLANGSTQGYGGLRSFAPETAFDSIATSLPTSGTSITFSSIPGTYKHLQIRLTARNSLVNTGQLQLTFNNDNGYTYSFHELFGDGSTVTASGSASADPYIRIGAATITTANMVGVAIIDIIDYASTSKNKTVRLFSGQDSNGAGRTCLYSGNWRSTSAITSIKIEDANGGSFQSGTRIALYGIKG